MNKRSLTAHRSLISRSGFSYIELLVVMGIIAIIGITMLVSLGSRKRTADLTTTTQRMASLLREAQSRSMGQASSSAWGVHFDNGGTPFFALFSGTYSTSSRESYYPLPLSVSYVTSTIAANRFAEVTFAQISGLASGSTTIRIALTISPTSSSTLTIDPSGAVSY